MQQCTPRSDLRKQCLCTFFVQFVKQHYSRRSLIEEDPQDILRSIQNSTWRGRFSERAFTQCCLQLAIQPRPHARCGIGRTKSQMTDLDRTQHLHCILSQSFASSVVLIVGSLFDCTVKECHCYNIQDVPLIIVIISLLYLVHFRYRYAEDKGSNHRKLMPSALSTHEAEHLQESSDPQIQYVE